MAIECLSHCSKNVPPLSIIITLNLYSRPKILLTKSFDMSAAEIVRARRTCTVPIQLLRSFQLPSLSSAPPVPKRYEETKPVKVQNFTHQRIIGMLEAPLLHACVFEYMPCHWYCVHTCVCILSEDIEDRKKSSLSVSYVTHR